ncbi:MAG: hypothetical protein NTV22_01210 [bacterium]|nr:hypothetical protein [bacterium]
MLDTVKRIRTTLGKYIRRQCGIGKDDLRDNLLNALCGYVFRIVEFADSMPPEFIILTGQAISDFYRVGPTSCMSGNSAKYTHFYAINPDKVALVTERRMLPVPTNDGKCEMELRARALLWTSDKGARMLDRVYISIGDSHHNEGCCEEKLGNGSVCICDTIINRFRTWALKNKIINRGSLCDRFDVTMNVADYVPYMDTLCYGSYVDDDTLRITNKHDEYSLQSTSGNRPEADGTICNSCGERIGDDNVYWGDDDPYCSSCFYDRYFICRECGETYGNDDCTVVKDHDYCDECAGRLFVMCDVCDEHVAANGLTTVNISDGTNAVCESCLEEYVCCAGCLEYFDGALIHTSDEGDEVLCEACFEDKHEPEVVEESSVCHQQIPT